MGWSVEDAQGLIKCFEVAFDIFSTKFFVFGFAVSAMQLAMSIICLYVVMTILRGVSKK